MIESIMYLGIGFLFATLVAVAVIPLVHARAVRLTLRRLEQSIPQSLAEIQADKDLLRADFAMSTRRLEIDVEELREQTTSQFAELGRKSDVINRLKFERQAQTAEAVALKIEVDALKERLAAASRAAEMAEFQRHEPDVASLVPKDWPRGEQVRVPIEFSEAQPRNEPRHESDVVALALQSPTTQEAGDGSSRQRIGIVREKFRGPAVLPAESSIHVSPDDLVAHDGPPIGKRTTGNVARISLVALIGIGAAFAWRSFGDGATETIGNRASPLSRLLFASTPKAPPAPAPLAPAPATTASAEVVKHPEAVARDLADVRSSAEKPATTQEEPDPNIGTPQSDEPDSKQKLSSAPPQTEPILAPVPDTPPTTVAGWALLEVMDGTAVVKGPNGIVWRVTRGDTVPGVGRVDSIVRWGNRWIVATSGGLISTP